MAKVPTVLVLNAFGRPRTVATEVLRLLTDEVQGRGGHLQRIDLQTLGLPLFDGEEDIGPMVPVALDIAQKLAAIDALIIVAPEFHQGLAPVVKNALDWAARVHELRHQKRLLSGQPIAIVTLSKAPHLGVQAMTQLAAVCHALGGRVLPGSMGVLDQPSSLNEDGRIKDKGPYQRLLSLAAEAVSHAKRVG